MRDGKVDVFVGLGGNFVAATPDTEVDRGRPWRNCRLTVHVSTKLNRSHLHHGRAALILPCLGRTERDTTAAGDQSVTVEDSMSMVHALDRAAGARLAAAAQRGRDHHRARARALFGADDSVDWSALGTDYRTDPQAHRARRARLSAPSRSGRSSRAGSCCRNGPRDSRTFDTDTGKANFTVNTATPLHVPPGHLLLQTVRSHDQFNTTVYGLDDRYRGIKGGAGWCSSARSTWPRPGCADGDLVDLVSVAADGERRANGVPGRRVRHPGRLRRRVLPRGERAGAARLDRRRQQHAGVEVDRDPPRAVPTPA